jgi:hypothetical protein
MRRVITTIAALMALLSLVVGCGAEAGREADPHLEALHPELYDEAREGNECRTLLDLHSEAVHVLKDGNRALDVSFSTDLVESTSAVLAAVDASEIRLAQLECSDAPDQFATLRRATCDRLQAAFDRAEKALATEFTRAANDQMEAVGCYEN